MSAAPKQAEPRAPGVYQGEEQEQKDLGRQGAGRRPRHSSIKVAIMARMLAEAAVMEGRVMGLRSALRLPHSEMLNGVPDPESERHD